MASSLLTVARPFLHPTPHQQSLFSPRSLAPSSPSSLALRSVVPVSRRNGGRVVAMAQKWEAGKVVPQADRVQVVPQADRVLVRLEELPEKSSGGVLLPKSAVKFERYLMGEILSVGADVEQVSAGKKVLFSDINAYEVNLGTDAKHCFCRAGDLLAVVE